MDGAEQNLNLTKMLDRYVLDYMLKNNLNEAAQKFLEETNLSLQPVEIDAPDGFLHEWWSFFYECYFSREKKVLEDKESYIKAMQLEVNEQEIQGQQYQMIQAVQPNHFSLSALPNEISPENILAFKMYEEQLKHPPARDIAYHSHMQQHIHSKTQHQVVRDNTYGINLTRSFPVEPMLNGVPIDGLPKSGLCEAVLNKGASSLPLNDSPLAFQLLTPQNHQDLLSQALVPRPGSPRSSLLGYCADIDPKGGQPTSTNSSQQISSMQTTSKKARRAPKDKADCMKNGKKGKQLAHSATGKSPSADNTTGLSPYYVPSTPTRALYNEMSIHNALSPSSSMSGDLQIPGSDQVGGLAKILDHKDVDGDFLDESVKSFLSQKNDDDHDMRDAPISTLKQSSADGSTDTPKDLFFNEVACLCTSKDKVVCCHFSSDGKFLASAGHDKKVSLWNMDTFSSESTLEEHSLLITDVRFRPNSTLLATSSFDRTVQVWNATDPRRSICTFVGHSEHVMSLDFHPKKVDLLCSCDANGEIRLWNVKQQACTRVSKEGVGGSAKIRFLPKTEPLLAAATENVIRIYNVETDQILISLKRHEKDVHSICWDRRGEYMASVSEDRLCIWSAASEGGCIRELQSGCNKFQSCTFHPGYPLLLVVGGYQTLQLWSLMERRTVPVSAHKGLITSLADCPSMNMVASASHDHCVKLWK